MYTDMHTEARKGESVGSEGDIRALGEPDVGPGPCGGDGRTPL